MSTFPYTRAFFHRADAPLTKACFTIKHPLEELYKKPFAVINGAVWVFEFSEARNELKHADVYAHAWLHASHDNAQRTLIPKHNTEWGSVREHPTKYECFLDEFVSTPSPYAWEKLSLRMCEKALFVPLQEPTMNAQNTRQFLTLANAVAIVVVKFNQDDRYNRTEAELKKYEYLTDIDGLAVGDYVTVRGQQGEIKVVKVVEVKDLDKQAYTSATPLKWVIDHVDMSGELAREELFIQFQRLEKALEAGRQKLESKKLFDLVKSEMSAEDRQLAAKLLGVRK